MVRRGKVWALGGGRGAIVKVSIPLVRCWVSAKLSPCPYSCPYPYPYPPPILAHFPGLCLGYGVVVVLFFSWPADEQRPRGQCPATRANQFCHFARSIGSAHVQILKVKILDTCKFTCCRYCKSRVLAWPWPPVGRNRTRKRTIKLNVRPVFLFVFCYI
jgi:hypothetical protein